MNQIKLLLLFTLSVLSLSSMASVEEEILSSLSEVRQIYIERYREYAQAEEFDVDAVCLQREEDVKKFKN